MSAGLEQIPAQADNDNMSALCSADFLTVISSPRSRPARAPILRLRNEIPVPTLESGMVNIDGLETFLHPNPSAVPLYATNGWKYHHINHPKSSFKQTNVPAEERDQSLVLYRNSPYQQVHMRVISEEIYHRLHQIEVAHPAEEVIEAALRDFERLNMLGAATLTLNLLKGNGNYKKDADSAIWSHIDNEPKKVYSFIKEVREECANAVVRAEVLTPRLVTSALKRLSVHLQDPFLGQLADRRLSSDPVFYPLKVPSARFLMIKAHGLFANHADLETIDSRGAGVESVQTDENTVEFIAA